MTAATDQRGASSRARCASRQRRGALLLSLVLASPVLAVDAHTVHIAPADDPPLAAMLLVGVGTADPVLLFDPQDPAATRRFLDAVAAPVECLVRPTTPAAERAALEAVAGAPCQVIGDLAGLAHRLWPSATRVVLAPAARYGWLLRGAAFAGSSGAALLPVDDGQPLSPETLRDWASEHVYAVPGADGAIPAGLAPERVTKLHKLDAYAAEVVHALRAPPQTVVVANPKDRDGRFSPSALSLLAPLLAAMHGAPLFLVADPTPDAVETAVGAFLATHGLTPTHIALVGDELALPSHRVPDPVLQAGGPAATGGGTDVRVELFSEIQRGRPQDYAVGRLVAEDLAQGSALLARQLHRGGDNPDRVTFLSNAEQTFVLGETISRTTASELRNAGVPVRARYREQITPAAIKDALEHTDVLVWEGHARDLTLEERGGIAVERTPPLVILQGCYTLDRSDPFILLERGTEAVVATSAAIYSASGSAFARAFFDALTYDGADLGTAVRNARNYLFALTELKKRRGHGDWAKTYRAALAFALWGDPAWRPPLPAAVAKLAPARWRLDDHGLDLVVPKTRLEATVVGRYAVQPVPRAMLSGLIVRDGSKPERGVKELFYTTLVAPADVSAACSPAPGWEVVSFLAPHTRTLSVLLRPPGDGLTDVTPAGQFRLPLVADATDCRKD